MSYNSNGLPSIHPNINSQKLSIPDEQRHSRQAQPSYTFEELARIPLSSLLQKNDRSLLRISKRPFLLPELTNKSVRTSNATKQSKINEHMSMQNAIELNKITTNDAAIQTMKGMMNSDHTSGDQNVKIELRGLKMSFRKKVFEPLERFSILQAALSSKRHYLREQNSELQLNKKGSLIRRNSVAQKNSIHSGRFNLISLVQPSKYAKITGQCLRASII